jgi:hypothetical protein
MVGLRDPQIGTRNSKAEAAACSEPRISATSAARTAAIRRAVAIGRAAAQHALDSRQEVAWLIGFGDVIVGAGPLTLHQADQARADFAAKRISLICDAHVIPFPELEQR